MSVQPVPPVSAATTAGQLAARATQNDQVLAAALSDAEDRITALESGSGTSGSSNLTVVSGSVALDNGLPVGTLVGYRATASTTFTGEGGSVALAAGVHIFERVTGGWTYRTIDEGSGLTPPVPDSTPPTAGTLGVTVTATEANLTVTGAMDDIALHASPYSYSKDNGATWTAWQAGATYQFTSLTPSTAYTFKHRVRDAALNVRDGASVGATTPYAPTWVTLSEDDFESAPNDTPLDGFVPSVGSALNVYSNGEHTTPATAAKIVDGLATSPVASGWQPHIYFGWSGLSAYSGVRATIAYDHTAGGTGGITGIRLPINGAFTNHLTFGVKADQTVHAEKYGSGTLSAPTVAGGAPTIGKAGVMTIDAQGTANGQNWTITVSFGGQLHSTFTFTGNTVYSTAVRLMHSPSATAAAAVGIESYKIETTT